MKKVKIFFSIFLSVLITVSAFAAVDVFAAEGALDIKTALNGNPTGEIINAEKDTQVKVAFYMQAPMLLEDGQGTLYYDSSKLTLDEFKMPNVTSGLMTNKKIPDQVKFNFMGVDSDTESGLTDFKENKVFVTAKFTVKDEGETTVNLVIEDLDGYENGSKVEYYTFSEPAPEAASITESLSKPDLVIGGEETEPYYQETEPETQATNAQVESGSLDITTALNGNFTGTVRAETGAKVTVTFNMQVPMLIEDAQGVLYYDSSKLFLDEFSMPNVTSALAVNKKIPDQVKFNFMGVDSETESGIADFKENKAFVTAVFTVIDEGSTTVNLAIEELDGFENGSKVAYYTFGKPAPEAASITESLSKPDLVIGGEETEPETQASEAQTETQPESQETQPESQETQPESQEKTEPTGDFEPSQPETEEFTLPPAEVKTYSYIPNEESIADGNSFRLTVQDTKGQFYSYELKPTGETVDGQQVYQAEIPAEINPAVINYQVFNDETYISQVTKSAYEVSDNIVVKYDGSFTELFFDATQPVTNAPQPETKRLPPKPDFIKPVNSDTQNQKSDASETKKANPVKVKAKKAVKVKAKSLKKKALKVKISKFLKITGAKGDYF